VAVWNDAAGAAAGTLALAARSVTLVEHWQRALGR
jgi:hypothetical protein